MPASLRPSPLNAPPGSSKGLGSAPGSPLEAVQVPIGGGSSKLPLARLVPAGQLQDLEDLLDNRS